MLKKNPIKISKQAIRIPKPQPKKLRIVRNGKTPTKEELLEMIRPLIPEIPPQVVKNTPKKALIRLIEEYIANKPLTPPTVDFDMKETDAGTEVTINGVMRLIPRAVYGPKLRNLQQMGDVSLTNPSEGQGLVFKDGYWKNETIGELDTLQSVTDRGATTTNVITADGFIGDGSQLSNLPIPDTSGLLTKVNRKVEIHIDGIQSVSNKEILVTDGVFPNGIEITGWEMRNDALDPTVEFTGDLAMCDGLDSFPAGSTTILATLDTYTGNSSDYGLSITVPFERALYFTIDTALTAQDENWLLIIYYNIL